MSLDTFHRKTNPDDPYILSHSGARLGPGYPAPSLEDIGISLGRICRFAGHCTRFWSVLQHVNVVAELCQPEDRPAAYLHDAAETLLSDIPSPFKVPEMKELENTLLKRIFADHLTLEQRIDFLNHGHARIKAADEEAFAGEVFVIGTKAHRELMPDRSPRAERLVRKYLRKYSFDDLLRSDGLAISDFVRKVTPLTV